MTRWFLNLFPAFRAALQEIAAANLRTAAAEHEVSLLAETIVAQKEAIRGAQATADFFCQRVTGHKIYGELPALPESAGAQPLYKTKRQARDLVNEGRIDFAEEMKQMLQQKQ